MSKEEMIRDVDISKIEEGQIVKNYRQMCDLLGEERTTGNAKKAQMANWERFFSITKIKGTQKMRIDEIYIEPLERVDGRAKGGRSIKYTVMHEMGFETEQEIYLSGKMKDFYKGVNYYLSKLYGYTRAYTQFKILFNKDHVCQEMPKLAQRVIDRLQEIEEMGDERIREELISMNNLVVDAFYKSAEKDYSNTIQRGKFQLAYDFVDRQKYLTDALIRRKDNEKVIEYDSSDIDELFTGLMAN